MPALLVILAVLAVLLAFRTRSQTGWEGLNFGDSESRIVQQLGEPDKRVAMDFGLLLYYPDKTLEVHADGLYSVQVFADRDELYRKALLYYGTPVESAGRKTDWASDQVVVRLYGDELMVSRVPRIQ